MPQKGPPRRMYVKKADLRTHGYTAGCVGCKALATGNTQIAYNEACRRRVATAISTTGDGASRIKAVRQREDEYIARHIEKSANIDKSKPGDLGGHVPFGSGEVSPALGGQLPSDGDTWNEQQQQQQSPVGGRLPFDGSIGLLKRNKAEGDSGGRLPSGVRPDAEFKLNLDN